MPPDDVNYKNFTVAIAINIIDAAIKASKTSDPFNDRNVGITSQNIQTTKILVPLQISHMP